MGRDVVESGLDGRVGVEGKIVGWVVEEGAGMGKHLYGRAMLCGGGMKGRREGGGERRRGGRRREGGER